MAERAIPQDVEVLLTFLNSGERLEDPMRKAIARLLETGPGEDLGQAERRALNLVWDRLEHLKAKVVLQDLEAALEGVRIRILPATGRDLEARAVLEFALYLERYNGRRPITRCRFCERWFQGPRADRSFCTKECSNAFYARKYRETIPVEVRRRKTKEANRRHQAKLKRLKEELSG